MEQDLLSEVIKVEKEIQKSFELEKAASREWLEQAVKGFEEEAAKEEKTIEESVQPPLAKAKSDADARALELEANARRSAERITTVNNETLRRLLVNYWNRILPG